MKNAILTTAYEREAVNVAIGIRSDGGKAVLDYSIAPTENGAARSEERR